MITTTVVHPVRRCCLINQEGEKKGLTLIGEQGVQEAICQQGPAPCPRGYMNTQRCTRRQTRSISLGEMYDVCALEGKTRCSLHCPTFKHLYLTTLRSVNLFLNVIPSCLYLLLVLETSYFGLCITFVPLRTFNSLGKDKKLAEKHKPPNKSVKHLPCH